MNNDGQLYINFILGIDNSFKSEPIVYCPSLCLDLDQIKDFKAFLKEDATSLIDSCVDDNIFANEIKISARNFVKKKIGLKPSTHIEIIRI